MKVTSKEIKKIQDKRVLKGILFIFPITIFAWENYIFPGMHIVLASIIKLLVIISVIIGIYNFCNSSEEAVIRGIIKKGGTVDIPNKKIVDGRIVDVDKYGRVIKEKTEKEKDKGPWIYRIPYEIITNGIFFLWALAGAAIAEYAEEWEFIQKFDKPHIPMSMLWAFDTIVCLGIWFIYMGYFYEHKKRKLFLILVVLIYIVFYLFVGQYY